MKHKIRSLLIILIFVCGCKNQSPDVANTNPLNEYSYTEDFIYYFKNTFKEELSAIKPKQIFIIPISSCTPCVDKTLFELQSINNKESILILVGQTNDESRKEKLKALKSKFTTFEDTSAELYLYETNIGKPTLFILQNDNISSITLNTDVWDMGYSFLNNLKTKEVP